MKAGADTFGHKKFIRFKTSLKLQNVNFEFSSNAKVLKDINLTINKNESIAIIGESGSGKSTLMNILAGLLIPSSGLYSVDAVSIQQIQMDSFRKKLGYIIQDPAIFTDTIFNNVSFWDKATESNLRKFNTAFKVSRLLNSTLSTNFFIATFSASFDFTGIIIPFSPS